MTTNVVIATPTASSMAIGIYVQDLDATGQPVGALRPWVELTDGRSVLGYVSAGCRLVIAEVPRAVDSGDAPDRSSQDLTKADAASVDATPAPEAVA